MPYQLGKFSLSTTRRHIGEVEFQLHSFVTSALDGSELPRHIKITEPSHLRTIIRANLFSGKITFLVAKSKFSVLLLSSYFIWNFFCFPQSPSRSNGPSTMCRIILLLNDDGNRESFPKLCLSNAPRTVHHIRVRADVNCLMENETFPQVFREFDVQVTVRRDIFL